MIYTYILTFVYCIVFEVCCGQIQLDITVFLTQFAVCIQILNFEIRPGDLAILKERKIIHTKSWSPLTMTGG